MTESDKGTKTAEKEDVKKDDKQQVNDKQNEQNKQNKEEQTKKPSSGGCCGGH
jgi:hypothetical protein